MNFMQKVGAIRPFSLNHLSETEFEEFCYDLLAGMGAVNITWRKGTGLPASPSDSGRDIECQFERKDIDGANVLEKWFVECKHYKKGVPPAKLQSILTWAKAERPEKILIIASNFLSNPAKDFLASYARSERPYFAIKKWERPDLERLTLGRTKLRRKYKIDGDFPHLALLHPAHIIYSRNPNANTLDYFFKALEQLDAKKRDEIMGWTYINIVNPRLRKPISENESYYDLMLDEISYEAFKGKCIKLTQDVESMFLIQSIVDFTLRTVFNHGDATSIDEWKNNHKAIIKRLQEKVGKGEKVELHQSMIQELKDKLQSMDKDVEERYSLYQYFCETVVRDLLVEEIKIIKD